MSGESTSRPPTATASTARSVGLAMPIEPTSQVMAERASVISAREIR